MLLASFPISPVRIRHKLHSIIFPEGADRTVVIPGQRDEAPISLAQLHPVTLTAFLLHICCDHSFMIIFKWVAALHWWPQHLKSHLPVTLGNTIPKYSLLPAILWLLFQIPMPLTEVKCLFQYWVTKYSVSFFQGKKKKDSHWSQVGNILVLCLF